MDIALMLEETSLIGINLINRLSKENSVRVISRYEDLQFIGDFMNSECIIIGSSVKDEDEDPVSYLIRNSLLTGIISKLIHEEKLATRLVHISSLAWESQRGIRQETAAWVEDFKMEYYYFLNTMNLYKVDNVTFKEKLEKFTCEYLEFHTTVVDYSLLDLCLSESFVLDTYKSVIVRTPTLYGSTISEGCIISAVIDAKLLGYNLEVINEIKDYVHVNDFIECIDDILSSDFDEDNRIVDLSSGQGVSTKKIVDYIDRMIFTGYGAVDVIWLNDADSDELKYESSHFQTNQHFFNRPMIRLEDGIRELIIEQQSSKVYNMKLNHELESFIGKDEELIQIMNGGGSSSHLMVLRSISKDKKFVRKVALREGVEGNGIPKLKSEIAYINSLTEKRSNLAHRYPRILRIGNFSDTVFYDMDYFNNGDNLVDSLSKGLTIEQFYIALRNLFEDILPNNYLIDCRELGEMESQEMLGSFMLNRAKARVRNLFVNYRNDYTEMLQQLTITINGKVYRNPISIINEIEQNSRLKEIFRPRFSCKCVHGDLTFLNMILNSQGNVIMIDPRGSNKEIDILYDFGKMKFSLSGFSEIIKGNYTLKINERDGITFEITDLFSGNEKIELINENFLCFLQELSCFEKMMELEPYWKERILLYEAINYLADIPFRLHTDSNPSNSIVCYLYGTIYLNNIYESACNPGLLSKRKRTELII